jgi:hypothetical protein
MEIEGYEPEDIDYHSHDVSLQELLDMGHMKKSLLIRCGEKYKPIKEGHRVELSCEEDQDCFIVVEADGPRDYYPTTVELLSGGEVALRGVFKRMLTEEGRRVLQSGRDSQYRRKALEMEWPGARHTNTLYASLKRSYTDKVMDGQPLRVIGIKGIVEISPDLSEMLSL